MYLLGHRGLDGFQEISWFVQMGFAAHLFVYGTHHAKERVAIQALLGLLIGDPSLAALGSAGLYTQLHYTREMEREADTAALAAVQGVYGHIRGA